MTVTQIIMSYSGTLVGVANGRLDMLKKWVILQLSLYLISKLIKEFITKRFYKKKDELHHRSYASWSGV